MGFAGWFKDELRLLAILGCGFLVGGCRCIRLRPVAGFFPVSPPCSQVERAEEVMSVPASDPYSPLDQYPLRPGDRIEFTLSIDPQLQGGRYRLMIGDLLNVEYLHERPGTRPVRTMRILPDGTIDLPHIGRVQAAGKTVEELNREVNRLARKYYKHPRIAIWATEPMGRAEELRRAYSTGFSNQSLTVVVGPDGTIDLPEIGRLQVFGKTLPQVRDEANALYGRKVPGVSVWPRLAERAPDQVYVLGQVARPGRYLLDRPTHVSQVLALAGGYNLGAELRQVVLIRYREGAPQVRRLNLHWAVWQDVKAHQVDLSDDILLADGDVIVVPRDHLQSGDDLVRRLFSEGIYGVLPIPRVTQ